MLHKYCRQSCNIMLRKKYHKLHKHYIVQHCSWNCFLKYLAALYRHQLTDSPVESRLPDLYFINRLEKQFNTYYVNAFQYNSQIVYMINILKSLYAIFCSKVVEYSIILCCVAIFQAYCQEQRAWNVYIQECNFTKVPTLYLKNQ